jgi:hypothetical protein
MLKRQQITAHKMVELFSLAARMGWRLLSTMLTLGCFESRDTR